MTNAYWYLYFTDLIVSRVEGFCTKVGFLSYESFILKHVFLEELHHINSNL